MANAKGMNEIISTFPVLWEVLWLTPPDSVEQETKLDPPDLGLQSKLTKLLLNCTNDKQSNMVKYKFILLIMTFVGHKKELQMHCLAAIQMHHELDDSKSPVSSEFIFMGIGKVLPYILR